MDGRHDWSIGRVAGGVEDRPIDGRPAGPQLCPDTAFSFALPVARFGFWVFVIWPRVLEWGWGWWPEIRR
jgi:hypothetical protein